MKKNVIRMALMSLALTVATSAQAQIDLGDLADEWTDGEWWSDADADQRLLEGQAGQCQ